MAVAERNLLSLSWQMLIRHEQESGLPVSHLLALCRRLANDEEIVSYLEPNAIDNFRRFLCERPDYFHYNEQLDKVDIAENSENVASERWLVKYLVHCILDSSRGCVAGRASGLSQLVLPKCVADHLANVYGGSLELFCRTHPSVFILDSSGTAYLVRGGPNYCTESFTSYNEEIGLFYFFINLLQKIGATKAKPCPVRMLTHYVCFMRSSESQLLSERYYNNLYVFFFFHPEIFGMKNREQVSVYLKYHDMHYAVALLLRQLLYIQGNSAISLSELALRAKHASSPVTQYLSATASAETEMSKVLLVHSDIFSFHATTENVELRSKLPPGARWNSDSELLVTAYFVYVLRDINATSPARAVCFNYIICAASSAPPKCKEHLNTFYPGLEIIGLFHLHPEIFDLSSVNRVSLHAMDTPETVFNFCNEKQVENQAVEYAARLLKYVSQLTPRLFLLCTEALPDDVRIYCKKLKKARLQFIIEKGRASLAGNLRRTGIIATSEASAQTVTEPASQSLLCRLPNPDTENKDETHQVSQKATTRLNNKFKLQDPERTLHQVSSAEPCILEAQGDVVMSTNARKRGAPLSFAKADAAVHLSDQEVQAQVVVCKKAANQPVPTPLHETSANQRKGKKYRDRVIVSSKKVTASAPPAEAPSSVQQIETEAILSKNAGKKTNKRAAATLHSEATALNPNCLTADVDLVVTERATSVACVFNKNLPCGDKQRAGQASQVSSFSGKADSTGEAPNTCVQSVCQTGGDKEERMWANLEAVAATSPPYLKCEDQNSSLKSKNTSQPSVKEATQPNQQLK